MKKKEIVKKSLFSMQRLFFQAFFWLLNSISFRYVLPNSASDIFERTRVFFMRLLGSSIGKNAFVRDGFWTNNFRNIEIGNNGTIGINCQFYSYEKITIGNNFLIGSDVIIHTSEHNAFLCEKPFIEQGSRYSKVTIGNNVYIGSKAVLLPGVKIGDNVVIGAGAVVTKNLESGGIYGGVPAKFIKPLMQAR